jgi:NADH:ubiquinone oxidoreductase subunit F (NADH-binding)
MLRGAGGGRSVRASADRVALTSDHRSPTLIQGGARTLAAYQRHGGYRAFEAAQRQRPDAVISEIETSELRGRGGAGFPVGRKWRSAASQPASEKFIIANADEGDAGAYIDRFLLEDDPHAVIEGMLIAAHAVGATKGWIYLRSEYPAARPILERAVTEARSAGLLGKDVLGKGRSFDIEIHVGWGSYVCGEETALIRSLEGKRPEVVARPPYATEQGLFGRPTVMNNVETLVNVPWILQHGGAHYRGLGFSKSRGTKVVSLNSLFLRPGLYEVEFGVSVRHIVEELGGGLRDGAKLKGVILGGPLAGIIPPHLLDTPFGFEELRAISASVGHGGVIAFDDHTSIAALLHHVFAFAADESCGKCTPCRLGSRRVERVLADILENGATDYWDEKDCEKIVEALKWTSLCGLGVGLAEFAESALRHYGKELEPCLR